MRVLILIVLILEVLLLIRAAPCFNNEKRVLENSPPSCVFHYCSNNFTTPTCTFKSGYYSGPTVFATW